MELYNSDCLQKMKDISNNSIDILITDLPYAQTSCKWDILIDMDKFWKEVNRICKIDCPMFFFCSVKFGHTLINSNPKNFRYELIWIKSQACGFLQSKKMPMKKNEMLYVFYRKLPKVYTDNIAKYHTHKFIQEEGTNTSGDSNSVDRNDKRKNRKKGNESVYEPKLPTNVLDDSNIVLRTDEGCKGLYGDEKGKIFIYDKEGKLRNSEPRYEPKLPTNVLDEGRINTNLYRDKDIGETLYRTNKEYEPKLPTNILEFKSEKGKHPTQKPVELIKWVLKYYSNENDLCIDATMGSGSTGVACKEMNRRFIGIELDKDIYETALKRIKSSIQKD